MRRDMRKRSFVKPISDPQPLMSAFLNSGRSIGSKKLF